MAVRFRVLKAIFAGRWPAPARGRTQFAPTVGNEIALNERVYFFAILSAPKQCRKKPPFTQGSLIVYLRIDWHCVLTSR